jgi:UDP-2,4-diacetamido-2,4,6-trideoxy-beta-L-altropyranose hydrolase
MKARESVIIRADADARMGTGHLMRCLALGQAWKDAGGEVLFLTRCANGNLLARIREEGFSVCPLTDPASSLDDLRQEKEILRRHPRAWWVLDGYHFDPSYQLRLKTLGARLLVIDDMNHLPCYHADLVLNQNIHAVDLAYSCPSGGTRFLLGPRYALLRREFLRWKEWKRNIPKVAGKILVTLGGSDPDNATPKVVRGLRGMGLPGLEVSVVAGATNPNREEIEKEMAPLPPAFRLLTAVEDMPRWMAWADMAISAGGSTVWEMAFMGLPNLVLVLADNQFPIAGRLGQEGISGNLGWADSISPAQISAAAGSLALASEKRREMAEKGRGLVDGLGGSRVAAEMKE